MRSSLFIGTSLALLLLPAIAQATTNDLALTSVTFSKKELIAGDSVRIYARVTNNGSSDQRAIVTFWAGTTQIDSSQPISVLTSGIPDDVYVDFIVPEQPFNIRAEVKGMQPGDQNPANDEAVTPLMSVIPDADRDTIPDSRDSCPNTINADQKDTDHDGLGDVCDTDIDGDGLTNSYETARGTNPYLADTDGDGVPDGQDAFPLDSTHTKNSPAPASLQTTNSGTPTNTTTSTTDATKSKTTTATTTPSNTGNQPIASTAPEKPPSTVTMTDDSIVSGTEPSTASADVSRTSTEREKNTSPQESTIVAHDFTPLSSSLRNSVEPILWAVSVILAIAGGFFFLVDHRKRKKQIDITTTTLENDDTYFTAIDSPIKSSRKKRKIK